MRDQNFLLISFFAPLMGSARLWFSIWNVARCCERCERHLCEPWPCHWQCAVRAMPHRANLCISEQGGWSKQEKSSRNRNYPRISQSAHQMFSFFMYSNRRDGEKIFSACILSHHNNEIFNNKKRERKKNVHILPNRFWMYCFFLLLFLIRTLIASRARKRALRNF